jgi:hypothetical protein
MPRRQKKYHYIYKTICLVNERYYIGMHSTDDLEDGYVGSGKRLWYSINKYGKENHKIEILEFLPNRKKLKEREKEIVNEELVLDVNCMNLQLGGGGGFISEDQQRRRAIAGGNVHKEKLKNDKEYRKKFIKWASNNLKNYHKNFNHNYATFTGKNHTEETKKKMSESSKGKGLGKNNSQYGTCWIHHLEKEESKKIKKEELESYLSEGWIKGRKMKF